MKIADLHNDILTSGVDVPDDYFDGKDIVAVIYNDGRSFRSACELGKGLDYVSFEDVGYADFDLDLLAARRPVYVGLTWNGENAFGYGCALSGGLKSEGRRLVSELNAAGIAVDTAHLSRVGFKDVIDLADTVINSHSCFCPVYRHRRNLERWQTDLIVEKGGLVGLTLCAYFMADGGVCGTDEVIAQIDFFCERYGADHLCVGTDYFGTDRLPVGFTGDYFHDYRLLADALRAKGYAESDVDKIFYGNSIKFLEKTNAGIIRKSPDNEVRER